MLREITVMQGDLTSTMQREFTVQEIIYEGYHRRIEKVSGKSQKYAGTHALKIINIQLEEIDSGSASHNGSASHSGSTSEVHSSSESTGQPTISGPNLSMLDGLFQTLFEAVLQYDVLKHPNILPVRDRLLIVPDDRDKDNVIVNLVKLIELIEQSAAGWERRPLSADMVQALNDIEGAQLVLVMDHYDGSLDSWAKAKQGVYSQYQKQIADDMEKALTYVHDRGYIHLDIKPQNILVRVRNGKVNVAVADFGLAREIASLEDINLQLLRCGTPPYNGYPDTIYSKYVDLWSLGLLLAYMVCSFGRDNEITQHELIVFEKNLTENHKRVKSREWNPLQLIEYVAHELGLPQATVDTKRHIIRCLNPDPESRVFPKLEPYHRN